MVDFDRVVSFVDAAELACCHVQTLRRAAANRELEVIRRGQGKRARLFVRLSALDKWVKKQAVPASRVKLEA